MVAHGILDQGLLALLERPRRDFQGFGAPQSTSTCHCHVEIAPKQTGVLGPNQTLFRNTDIWTSYDFHVSLEYYSFDFPSTV